MRTSAFLQAPSALACRALSGRTLNVPSNGVRAQARAGNWFPGSDCPSHLTDDLVGNYGYDPLGISVEPENLARMRECEVINGRWAMLGVVGSLTVELLGVGHWYTGPSWVKDGGAPEYLGNPVPFDLKTLIAVELVLMGTAEGLRGGEPDLEKRIYPGGAFDPFGFSKGDKAAVDALKLKEIKNGRLAMFAMTGFYFQYYATGEGPLANWQAHISDPLGANFATNGISIPFF